MNFLVGAMKTKTPRSEKKSKQSVRAKSVRKNSAKDVSARALRKRRRSYHMLKPFARNATKEEPF